MKRLIINSDDYGRTPDISRGIREAHLNGVVTSTTCMMNIPTTAHDVALAVQETPRLGLGVHLVLTMGRPILPPEAVPSVVDVNGNHLKYDAFIQNLPHLNITEVKAEWRAQIEAFIRAAGRKPDHIDSHHHSSFFTPELFRGMLELAREYNCPIRNPIAHGEDPTAGMPEVATTMNEHAPRLMKEFSVRTTDTFFVHFYDEGATHAELLDILSKVANGTAELMCHPGYVDEAFAKESVYNFQRERELKILTDPAIKQAIETNGIELVTFANL
ncbi:MAG TPA: carbohydrate deacetylase [Anaerolineales bacterium]|nr:carbohydrate deacetylase [Anaerolineales bacterium]